MGSVIQLDSCLYGQVSGVAQYKVEVFLVDLPTSSQRSFATQTWGKGNDIGHPYLAKDSPLAIVGTIQGVKEVLFGLGKQGCPQAVARSKNCATGRKKIMATRRTSAMARTPKTF